MAVERIDAQIQALISSAQLESQKQVGAEDGEEAARKASIKKRAAKKALEKSQTLSRSNRAKETFEQAKRGEFGPRVSESLNAWENAPHLQSRLSDVQKRMFHEATAKNPQQAAKAGEAMARMSEGPGFQKAMQSTAQMGTLQQGMVQNPAAEQPISKLLQGRFMQSNGADAKAKDTLLRHGFTRAKLGKPAGKADDFLGSLAGQGLDRNAQRAAANMVVRRPDDGDAMDNVDTFSRSETTSKLPQEARSKATELLARANGKQDVRDGFEKLIIDPKFGQQTAKNQGRFFATIGTGRASEFRMLTDKSLSALKSDKFPRRASQVKQFLGRMASKVSQGGADGVDVDDLLDRTRRAEVPRVPEFEIEDDNPDAKKRNTAAALSYFNQMERSIQRQHRSLSNAKYLEDIHAVGVLTTPPAISTEGLDPELASLIGEKQASLAKLSTAGQELLRKQSRKLRKSRINPAKRRKQLARNRAVGRQPQYFVPGGKVPTFQTSAAPTGAVGGGGSLEQSVAAAISQVLGSGPLTTQNAGRVAKSIGDKLGQEIARQLQVHLGGSVAAAPVQQTPPPEVANAASGRTDAWGVPRTFEKDLGYRTPVVRPAAVHTEVEPLEEYRGKRLVSDPSLIRDFDALVETPWVELSKAEVPLLRNLGWRAEIWDARHNAKARWPKTMATAFASLTPLQRESVRKLGLTARQWDDRVQAFTMGKNA